MDRINDGGPAFGIIHKNWNAPDTIHYGMTLRDYFAIHANHSELDCTTSDRNIYITIQQARYRFADAMLKARGNNS